MKILIVDDVKGWRDYHSYIMNELFENVDIQTAESAREGYDKLMENNDVPFDIILTDMQMENGQSFCSLSLSRSRISRHMETRSCLPATGQVLMNSTILTLQQVLSVRRQ